MGTARGVRARDRNLGQLMESMSEEERYEHGCLSRELPEGIGNIAVPEVVEPPHSAEIPVENLGGLWD